MIVASKRDTLTDNFVECDGRELQVADYQELFTVLARLYGGSVERDTFKIPDLRWKYTIHGTIDP